VATTVELRSTFAVAALFGLATRAAPVDANSRTVVDSGIFVAVRDSAGHPLSGTKVDLFAMPPMAPVTVSGTTDSLGDARFTNLTPGPYRVTFRRLGFTPALWDRQVRPGAIDTISVVLRRAPAIMHGREPAMLDVEWPLHDRNSEAP
jgi:hypothetical protein